uniref:Uncharacterized protein n=1 Tax=viral metagenome TaxID=1070528 RepID=A0A6M3IIZ5_9ZZZZ
MIPVDQENTNDCQRACVASILELPLTDVPNFMLPNSDGWVERMQEFTKPYGFLTLNLFFTDGKSEEYLKDCYTIAGGESPRSPEREHAVVWKNGKMVHDPSPTRAGIVGKPHSYTVFIGMEPWKQKLNPNLAG